MFTSDDQRTRSSFRRIKEDSRKKQHANLLYPQLPSEEDLRDIEDKIGLAPVSSYLHNPGYNQSDIQYSDDKYVKQEVKEEIDPDDGPIHPTCPPLDQYSPAPEDLNIWTHVRRRFPSGTSSFIEEDKSFVRATIATAPHNDGYDDDRDRGRRRYRRHNRAGEHYSTSGAAADNIDPAAAMYRSNSTHSMPFKWTIDERSDFARMQEEINAYNDQMIRYEAEQLETRNDRRNQIMRKLEEVICLLFTANLVNTNNFRMLPSKSYALNDTPGHTSPRLRRPRRPLQQTGPRTASK